MRKKFISKLSNELDGLSGNMRSSVILQQDNAIAADQRGELLLQFCMHSLHLCAVAVSIDGLTFFKEEMVPYPACTPRYSDHYRCGFGNCNGGSHASTQALDRLRLSYMMHFSSQVTIFSQNGH